MYWNNPIELVEYPADSDIISRASHGGQHCLFYNPKAGFNCVEYQQSLQDLCDWTNYHIQKMGLEVFLTSPACFYDIANLVKLNMWVQDIRQQGNVKPWLMQDLGTGKFWASNGESRLRCLERIPEIQTVAAFVATHVDRAHLYRNLEQIHTFERFAELCGAVAGQKFLFRLTAPSALYGLDWYEYDSARTADVTPGESEAVAMMSEYFRCYPNVKITPDWFDQPINWLNYQTRL